MDDTVETVAIKTRLNTFIYLFTCSFLILLSYNMNTFIYLFTFILYTCSFLILLSTGNVLSHCKLFWAFSLWVFEGRRWLPSQRTTCPAQPTWNGKHGTTTGISAFQALMPLCFLLFLDFIWYTCSRAANYYIFPGIIIFFSSKLQLYVFSFNFFNILSLYIPHVNQML